MKLLRLEVRDWRAIENRQVTLGDGVTLIEGPNEIGKSSLVEALGMLLREADSSAKKDVKAIQPAGKDVGSTVTAEIRVGEHHFTYSKTFNKTKQTTLDIHAPKNRQITGREAHDHIQQLLAETVDMTLWEALLVTQGEKVTIADLKDSAGLAAALDRVAGSGSGSPDDGDLYHAVQREYERYFTLKAGQSKITADEALLESARVSRDDAQRALEEVEADVARQERLSLDVRNREQALPALQAALEKYEGEWKDVDTLQRELELKHRELATVTQSFDTTTRALKERASLSQQIERDSAALEEAKKRIAPLQSDAETARTKLENAEQALKDLKNRRDRARDHFRLTKEDNEYVHAAAKRDGEERRLANLRDLEDKLDSAVKGAQQILVDDAALTQIRDAENERRVAREKRDVAATRVTITAQKNQQILFGEESVQLPGGESKEDVVAARLHIELPGVATIEIAPPQSTAELETELEKVAGELHALRERYAVASLEEAIEARNRKALYESEIKRLKEKQSDLLAGESIAELSESIASLRRSCEKYTQSRTAKTAIPATLTDARRALAEADSRVDAAELAWERGHETAEQLRQAANASDKAYRDAHERLIGARATVQSLNGRLEQARAAEPDDQLKQAAQQAASVKGEVSQIVADLNQQLAALNPDRINALRENAMQAVARSSKELDQVKTELAVVDDRLEQAQANGRFEALEAAEATLDARSNEVDALRRRAAAARRLWETLTKHRDEARQTYVQPLREAIERLGRIVFAPDFEVALNDDWSIESRTMNGKTLPYSELSIGAKEQLSILARLAAARITSSDGGVPMIIDDALGFSDPSRLETMGAAISAAGKECQIIILTCTPGRFANIGNAHTVRLS